MSDDDAYQEIRTAARRKLDDAIQDYAKAINTDDETIMGGIGGWVIAIYSPTTEAGRDAYVIESASNQPWHASVGLARYAVNHYEATE